MRRRIITLAFVVCTPIAAIAQQAIPPYTAISTFKVIPTEAGRWEEAAKQIVDAAGKARLKPQFGWGMWQNDMRYAIVGSMQKMAELDDPMMWMRQFNNTPGQVVLGQAFQKMTGMHFQEEDDVFQNVAEWSYAPAVEGPATWAYVEDEWLVGGSDEQADKLIREASAILKAANFPYRMIGARAPVGRRRLQFAILYDDPSKFEAATAKLEQNAQWLAMEARYLPLLVDIQTARWRSRPDLSYQPAQ